MIKVRREIEGKGIDVYDHQPEQQPVQQGDV
jgi:hypothetical protein